MTDSNGETVLNGLQSGRRGGRQNDRRGQVKYLSEEELDRLFSAVKNPRDLAILRIAYHRGLRASEIGLLQLSDYRSAAKRLSVHRLKGSHSGEYVLTDNERRALEAWIKVRGDEPGPLFPSNRGNGINRRTFASMMRKYGALANLPMRLRHPHVLKHSCGTHLLSDMHMDVTDVQDHLGHADIRNTMVYAKITNRRRDENAERLRKW